MDSQNNVNHVESEEELLAMLHGLMNLFVTFLHLVCIILNWTQNASLPTMARSARQRYSLIRRVPRQLAELRRLLGVSDEECINHLRMSKGAFSRLCNLLETNGGLRSNRNTSVPEQVAIFLSVIAHHTKIRVVKSTYNRSGRTISKHFHRVLNAIIKLHPLLLARPAPIDDSCENDRWRSFKGCLGALDGTYISVMVPRADRGRYRNRKGDISVNVLAVCDIHMNFVYVLSGWEGSAADARVLRDALARPTGLRVPRGCYYLCDSGYSNSDGFLTPYRGTRYHLQDWAPGTAQPQTKEEYFNMKHARARNVIERAFGILKKRWGILRSPSYYPIKTQNRVVMACCLLHNFIRKTMGDDPLEIDVPDECAVANAMQDEYVDIIETTPQWSAWRDALALDMFNNRHI